MSNVEQILLEKGPSVIVTEATTTVLEATRMMAEGNVGSVIIRTVDGPLGIFTERDLLKRVVAKGIDPQTTAIADVMSAPVKQCRLSDSIDDCARELTRSRIRHLVVAEDNTVIGVIGLRDILEFKYQSGDVAKSCAT